MALSGYKVTVVREATASYSNKEMHAALEITIPNYASAMVTTNEAVDAISSLQTVGSSWKFRRLVQRYVNWPGDYSCEAGHRC
jgi:hypothetical protein